MATGKAPNPRTPVFEKKLKSPVGNLTLQAQDGYLIACSYSSGLKHKSAHVSHSDTVISFASIINGFDPQGILKKATEQLFEYFNGSRQDFTLPVCYGGTEFQQRVLGELRKIPYGRTITYGELAYLIGSPRAARAVGLACNSNPISIIIPCHRVIGSNGKLTGYAGGVENKELLIKLEKFSSNK